LYIQPFVCLRSFLKSIRIRLYIQAFDLLRNILLLYLLSKWAHIYTCFTLWIQWLAAGCWVSPDAPVFSTNKTDRHVITEILLKVALNTIKPNQTGIVCVTDQTTIQDVYHH